MRIKEVIKDSILLKQSLLEREDILKTIEEIASKMIESLKNGNKIYWCGNGGSAADSQHLSAELNGRFYYDRAPLASEALHCNTSYMTAVSNDYGYDYVYSRMIESSAKKGDVLIGLSTSGNSKNICLALEKAKEMGLITVSFTGKSPSKMQDLSDLCIEVPSTDTPRIQEVHIMVGHILCELVEKAIFPR